VKWFARWWPALLWAVVISGFSTGAFTAQNTGRIIIPVLRWLFPHAAPQTIVWMHFVIRKCGHLTEYFILSLLILRGIRAGRSGWRWTWVLATILLISAYASLDEFHQSFVPGRTAAVTDVMIDTAGGAAAQVLAALLFFWGRARGERKQEGGG
jgi:VanZ family protein